MSSMRFGVNYVPSKNWWYSWVDWDRQIINDDFAAISALGCDHIRVHCLWTLVQPNPSMVSATMLARLREMLDVADSNGLDVVVTVLDGWLSGFDFRPSWLPQSVSIFANPDAITAQEYLLTEMAARIVDHPRFLGFDVANEPNVLMESGLNRTTSAQGDAWVSRLLAHCQQLAPGKLHSVGMDHRPWLTSSEAFSRTTLATAGTVTPIHAWVYFTGALERYGPQGTGTTWLARYMIELAIAHHTDPKRQVWLQEFGMSSTWAAPEIVARFPREVLTTLDTTEVWGATWWSSHDISTSLGGFLPLEHDLGLLSVDNKVKPAGAAFQEAVSAARSLPPSPSDESRVGLVLPTETEPGLTFADAFFALVDRGVRPAVVLQARAHDAEYLRKRGVSRLVSPTSAETLSASDYPSLNDSPDVAEARLTSYTPA